MSLTLKELMGKFPRAGHVEWIGIRPARNEAVKPLRQVQILMNGLDGDRRVLTKSKPGKRSVTLIQMEHIPLIASLAGFANLTPELLRRNIAVSGVNLSALRGQTFSIGGAILRGTDVCAPCSKMEALLREGGYNAMRGHGGICAEVVQEGAVSVQDSVDHIAD